MTKYVILAGGSGERLKFDTQVPKPCLELIDGISLIEYQFEWLRQYASINDIIISVNRKVYDYMIDHHVQPPADYVIEDLKLGTGGAIKNVVRKYPDMHYYIMNVDDLLFEDSYFPDMLLDMPKHALGQILTGFGRFPYGVIHNVSHEGKNLVIGFKQKPIIPEPVYIGHIAFKNFVRSFTINDFLPDKGDYENDKLPVMAECRLLYSKLFKGTWLTINDYKQLKAVRTYLRKIN